MAISVSMEQLKELLPKICDKKTSSNPKGWTPENPLWGHCAVVSLIVQNLFGGKLARASLEDTKFATMGSHYWNILPDGVGKDFTDSQFRGKKPILTAAERTRDYVLYDPQTGAPREIMNRYKLLAWRLAKELNLGNSLFKNDIYHKCFYNALDSPCQKMKFGCVITHYNKAVYEGCNKTIEPLKSLCEPKCIRFSITSRTESMLGACGHAEEGLWDVVHKFIPIHECELYIAGLHANGLSWLKQAAEHTCLRCAVQMYNAHLKTIYVPVVDRWVGITPEQAVETARAYAIGEKKV